MNADGVEAVRVDGLIALMLMDPGLQDIDTVRADPDSCVGFALRVDLEARPHTGVFLAHDLSPGLQEAADLVIGCGGYVQCRSAHHLPEARPQEQIDFLLQEGLHAHVIEVHHPIQILLPGHPGLRRDAARLRVGRALNLQKDAFQLPGIPRADLLAQSRVFKGDLRVEAQQLFLQPGISRAGKQDTVLIREEDILFPGFSFADQQRGYPFQLVFLSLLSKPGLVSRVQKYDKILLPQRLQKGGHGKRIRHSLRACRGCRGWAAVFALFRFRLRRCRRLNALYRDPAVGKGQFFPFRAEVVAQKAAVIDKPYLTAVRLLLQRGFMDEGKTHIQGVFGDCLQHAHIHAEGVDGAVLQLFRLFEQLYGKIIPVDRTVRLREVKAADDVLLEDAAKIPHRGRGHRERGLGDAVQKSRQQLRREAPADHLRLREVGRIVYAVARMRLQDQVPAPKEEVGTDLIDGDLLLTCHGKQIRKLLRKDQRRVFRNIPDGFQPEEMQDLPDRLRAEMPDLRCRVKIPPFGVVGQKALGGEAADDVGGIFVSSVQKAVGLGNVRHDRRHVVDRIIQHLRLGQDPPAVFKHVEGNAPCDQIQREIIESGGDIDILEFGRIIRHGIAVCAFHIFQDPVGIVGDRPVREQPHFIKERLQLPVIRIGLRSEVRQQQHVVLPRVDSLLVDDPFSYKIIRKAGAWFVSNKRSAAQCLGAR